MDNYDSPVIKEIPIFISQELRSNLMIYQYPLEDALHPDNATVLDCSMKDDKEVTFDLEREVESRNYNSSKGEQMAINVDGNLKPGEEVTYPRKMMDQQVLVSKMLPNRNVGVGLLQDGELHLTHALGVATLRPCYRHLDLSDKRAKQEAKDKGEEDGEEEEEELQQVTVKFARHENDRTKKNREKSFSYLSKQTAKQTWRKMDYHDSGSVTAEVEMGKLFCKQPGERVADNSPIGIAQLDAMVEEGSAGGQIRSSHGIALSRLTGTLIDRIKTILLSSRVVDMTTLNRILGLPASASELQDRIKVVQHVAVLVQGCWVVQSDVVIHKEATPCGVPSALARCARDYMLYQFTRSRTVTRSQLMEAIKVPGDVIKTMLEEVAVRNGKEWEFKLPTDVQFTMNYRDVEQRQQAKWELRSEQILAGLRPSEGGAAPTVRSRRRSGRESISSDTEGAEARKHYPGSKVRRISTRTSESKSHDTPT